MSEYARLLATGKNRYRSLKFDLDKLNNKEQYFCSYHIPQEEHMVVYAYSSSFSSLELEGNGTIITDQAIYFSPEHRDWADTNRIPLSDICDFIVYQEDSRDMVHMLSKERECRIFGRTVAPHDNTGQELVDLIQSLQRNIVLTDKHEKRRYQYTLAWALSRVKAGLRENGMLSIRHRMILSLIQQDRDFLPQVIMIQAEDMYRGCDADAYRRFIESLEQLHINKELINALSKPDRLFFDSYVDDLTAPSSIRMTRALISPYSLLMSKEKLSLHQAVILCLLAVRMDDHETFEPLLADLSDYMPPDLLWRLHDFDAKYKNERMSGVYEKLLTGVIPNDTEMAYTDDLGLSPLHYALCTRDEELVRHMLTASDWDEGHGPLGHDRVSDIVYNYVFAASVMYDSRDLIQEVFIHTSQKARPLIRSVRKLDNFIDIAEKMKQRAREKMRQAAAERTRDLHEGLKSEYIRNDDEIRRLIREAGECESRIDDYRDMRSEIENELGEMLDTEISEARARAQIISEVNHPLAVYIMNIYAQPDGLYYNLTGTITDWKLYHFRDIYFEAPYDSDIDLPWYSWKNQKLYEHRTFDNQTDNCSTGSDYNRTHDNENSYSQAQESERADNLFDNPRVKARKAEEEEKARQQAEKQARQQAKRRAGQEYGQYSRTGHNGQNGYYSYTYSEDYGTGSSYSQTGYRWFSQDAAHDITVLKHEYHALVRKYHPDSTGDASTAAILQQIMNERAEILERMS